MQQSTCTGMRFPRNNKLQSLRRNVQNINPRLIAAKIHQSRPNAGKSTYETASAPSLLYNTAWLGEQSLVMATASAVLGPLCDGMHSQFGVLHYTTPITPFSALGWDLETTWWTPLLFAIAGIILGVSHPLLDAALPEERPRGGREPSWLWVNLGIAAFVLQYYLSAQLDSPINNNSNEEVVLLLGSVPRIDVVLACTAVGQWAFFDGTRQGAFMAALTAFAGPAVEIILISLGLYTYAHPQVFGSIPTWIPWVYACGGPAVGNLGRKVAADLCRKEERREGKK